MIMLDRRVRRPKELDSKDDVPLHRYAESELPSEFGLFRMIVYREGDTDVEHIAIVAGDPEGERRVLTRVHSECFTGEVLGSLRCDCREQLHAALAMIGERGNGVVVYLRQEGRGIGLGNKIRAYALQSKGHDTVDANRILGFEDDYRSYAPAARILEDIGVESVDLLTNNPDKVNGLEKAGIDVERRLPLSLTPNAINRSYLVAKRDRMGHLLGNDLRGLSESEEPG